MTSPETAAQSAAATRTSPSPAPSASTSPPQASAPMSARRAAPPHAEPADLYERAETVARSIPDPDWQPSALVAVTEALARGGSHERAETIVPSVTAIGPHARALVTVATGLARVGHSAKARRLLARAWATGHWTIRLSTGASLEPQALCRQRLNLRPLRRGAMAPFSSGADTLLTVRADRLARVNRC